MNVLQRFNFRCNLPLLVSRFCSSSVDVDKNRLFPSHRFLAEAKNRGIQEKLSRLIAEIEVLKEVSHEVPLSIDDSHWDFLLHIRQVSEREEYIRKLYYHELNKAKTEQLNESMNHKANQVMEEKRARFAAGEMVYGRHFYDFLDLRGREFRKQIDDLYGSRLLAGDRVGESLPQIIVDCRYLQKNSEKHISRFVGQVKTLHDQNWFSKTPFPISIVNLFMDDFMARMVRKSWYFATGVPPKEPLLFNQEFNDSSINAFEEIEDVLPTYETEDFKKHEFAPRITSRGVHSVLPADVKPNEVAFISKSATKYLDGDLSQFKAFVLSTTFDNNSNTSSSIAAGDDGFTAYRLPIEKHLKWERGTKDVSFPATAAILRDVYTRKLTWKEAFDSHIPKWHLEKREMPKERPEIIENRKARDQRVQFLQQAVKKLKYRRIPLSGANAEPIGDKKPFGVEQRKERVHKYSREERNRRRQEEQERDEERNFKSSSV